MSLLQGVRVLEIGTALAGPYGATLLSDLGAEVVKLEKPRRGDLIRFTDDYVDGESGYFLGINRGKKGITADVRTPEGQEIVRRLASRFDVIIENFRGERMADWNLGYADLSAHNPRLIYCSVSAFDAAEGYEREAGNDVIAAAYSGILDLTGESDRPPAKPGAPVVDVVGACLAATGILAALFERERTGKGRHIRTSLLEAAFALMPNYMASVLNGEPDFHRLGSGHPQLVPYQAFACSDGEYVVVGAFHRKSWRDMCTAMGREDLLDDPRFTENWNRVENRDILIPIIEDEMLKRTAWDWVDIFRGFDMPVAPVLPLSDAVEYFGERMPGLVIEASHEKLGSLRMLRRPWTFDPPIADTEYVGAPTLGADTEELLVEAGYGRDEISELHERRII